MDLEREQLYARYRLCAAGFFISGLALGLLCLSAAVEMILFFSRDPWLIGLISHPWWVWVVAVPITCGALLGSYLLWGRWTDVSWQQRAGLLVVLNLCDTIFWFTANREALGFAPLGLQHYWVLSGVTTLFGWIEFMLFASLASEVSAHLGMVGAHEAGHTASKFAWTGVIVSSIYFLARTDWTVGWPLVPKAWFNELTFLTLLGTTFLRMICALQVAALCFVASHYCRRTLADLRREDEENDPLRSRSDQFEDDHVQAGSPDDLFRF